MKFVIKYLVSFILIYIVVWYSISYGLTFWFSLNNFTPLGKAYRAFYSHTTGIFCTFVFSYFIANVRWWVK